ncbi:MAG TPA: UDP-N-acetylglucosamine pyrophosphorylase [Syntrophales bacterium]|nr:UDP-N-acetylglucosamine pyrophosphorylase [Syntrophales bacterium]
MDLRQPCAEKVLRLIEKGVQIPNPLTIDIGEEVSVDLVSGHGVRIYPGCRIYGEKTVISAGVQIGYEAPATIDNCQIGPKVELKGGFFNRSVFLKGSSMGLGAQVREACILEEEASGAHCVGLKQTILFPFVTLGSLINFCDCLMAGGTSRRNHSEVGSSYIHFNFTPDGDKTTPSIIGDVPRGVMLREAPIFLGGQGGMVGPLKIGFGDVVGAGSILRKDYPEENKLILGKAHAGGVWSFVPRVYGNLSHIVENNVSYLGSLVALEEWYRWVRKGFLEKEEFGRLIWEGLLDKVSLAKKERVTRLKGLAEKAVLAASSRADGERKTARIELSEHIHVVESLSLVEGSGNGAARYREEFLADLSRVAAGGADYITTVQALSAEARDKGVRWLQHVVSSFCREVSEAMPLLRLFRK